MYYGYTVNFLQDSWAQSYLRSQSHAASLWNLDSLVLFVTQMHFLFVEFSCLLLGLVYFSIQYDQTSRTMVRLKKFAGAFRD